MKHTGIVLAVLLLGLAACHSRPQVVAEGPPPGAAWNTNNINIWPIPPSTTTVVGDDDCQTCCGCEQEAPPLAPNGWPEPMGPPTPPEPPETDVCVDGECGVCPPSSSLSPFIPAGSPPLPVHGPGLYDSRRDASATPGATTVPGEVVVIGALSFLLILGFGVSLGRRQRWFASWMPGLAASALLLGGCAGIHENLNVASHDDMRAVDAEVDALRTDVEKAAEARRGALVRGKASGEPISWDGMLAVEGEGEAMLSAGRSAAEERDEPESSSGIGWGELLGGLLATAVTAVTGVNVYRNRTRQRDLANAQRAEGVGFKPNGESA